MIFCWNVRAHKPSNLRFSHFQPPLLSQRAWKSLLLTFALFLTCTFPSLAFQFGGPPAAPTNLIATGADTSISLKWTASSSATGYTVKRATSTGGPYVTIAANVSTTNYTDGSVTNGTVFYYVVSARNTYGESANSNEANAIPVAAVIFLSLSLSSSNCNGGVVVTGSLTLNNAAPPGGAAFSLTSNNPAVAPVPATVIVPAGATITTFPINTTSVASSTPVTITATYGSTNQTALLTVNPATLTFISLSKSNSYAYNGDTIQCTVHLDQPAPSSGLVISLSSSNPDVAPVPSGITVPAGSATASTYIAISASLHNVINSTPLTIAITASYGGVTQTSALNVSAKITLELALPFYVQQGGNAVEIIEGRGHLGLSFYGDLTIMISGVPAGITYWFYPNTLTVYNNLSPQHTGDPLGTTNLYFYATKDVPRGTYPITITGTLSGLSDAIDSNLIVN